MITLRAGNTILDLYPGTTITRERNSPFFLVKKGSDDGMPGEVSLPFTFPLTDKNNVELGNPDFLPAIKNKLMDINCMDGMYQVTNGKLQLRETSFNLLRNNTGKQTANLLSNTAAFFKEIEGKYLTSLSLGGTRSFTWSGYSLVSDGWWKHLHDTWDYTSCDDGDYVFFPVEDPDFTGYRTSLNTITTNVGFTSIEMDRKNVTGLCPHPYLSYVIRKIFEEHGYTISGDIFSDISFKTITLLSFQGVYWADHQYPLDDPALVVFPLATVNFNLGNHLPPKVTIPQFLVEVQKFLPIGFDIDDVKRHCTVTTLGSFTTLKNMDGKVAAQVTNTPSDATKDRRVLGIKREFNTDAYAGGKLDKDAYYAGYGGELASLPIPAPDGKYYKIIDQNAYFGYVFDETTGTAIVARIADNIGDYEPTGHNDSMTSKMAPVGVRDNPLYLGTTYWQPYVEVEGNFPGRATVPSEWGLHVAFYKGKTYPLNNGTVYAPYATNTNNLFIVGSSVEEAAIDGAWSMGYELGDYGLIKYWWSRWLQALAEDEVLKGILLLPLHEYLQLKWSDELIIQNTSYILKSLKERLPYNGTVEFEAVRLLK